MLFIAFVIMSELYSILYYVISESCCITLYLRAAVLRYI